MSTRTEKRLSLTVVADGQHNTVGFLLARGPAGFEAWTADERSIGTFETIERAHQEIINLP